jgi:hypothetical protein
MTIAVLASIGIGVGVEAGSVAAGPKPRFRAAVDSLNAFPSVEMDLRASFPVSGVAEGVLAGTDVRVEIASHDRQSTLSAAQQASQLDEQISILEDGQSLADLRIVAARDAYIRLSFNQIASLPFVPPADRQGLREAGQLLDGTWFVVPRSVLRHLGSSSSIPQRSALRAEERAAGVRLRNDILAATAFSSRGVAGGTATSATVPLQAVVVASERDLLPLVREVLPKGLPQGAIPPLGSAVKGAARVRGTASVTVVTGTGDSIMRRASLVVVAGTTRVAIEATIRHDPLDLGVPAGARPIPRSILSRIPGIGSTSIS